MKNRVVTAMLSLLALVLMFGVAAASAGALAPEEASLLDLARPVLDALLAGQPGLAALLALVLATAAARRYGAKRWPWLGTDAGGTLLVLLGSFGGAGASLMYGGAAFGLSLMWTALLLAFAAAGGYTAVKRLVIVPLLRPLRDRAPAWLKPILNLALWVFERPDPVAKAEAAGAAAVTDKPSTGVAGIVGAPRDVE